MGFELPDGKTARNIYEQVKFLTEKLKELYAAFNDLGLKKIEVVDELPEVGDATTLYLLAKEDPDTGDYYDEYIWIDNAWELIGTTQIDLSNYVDLTSVQTITGRKTFSEQIDLRPDAEHSKGSIYFEYDTSLSLVNSYYYFTAGDENYDYAYISQAGISPTSDSDSTADLGTSSYKWRDLYLAGKANLTSTNSEVIKLGTSTTFATLGINASTGGLNITAGGSVVIDQNVRPLTDNTRDLGSGSYCWKDLWLKGQFVIKGTNNFYITNSGNYFSIGLGAYVFCNWGLSGLSITTTIKPETSNSIDLGASSNQWKDIYAAGAVKANYIGTYNNLYARAAAFAPEQPNQFDLGTSTYTWKDLYLAGNLSNGTDSATVADIAALITYAKAQGWIS